MLQYKWRSIASALIGPERAGNFELRTLSCRGDATQRRSGNGAKIGHNLGKHDSSKLQVEYVIYKDKQLLLLPLPYS